jgi:hypothetical protein
VIVEMAETLAQILTYINELLPNRINSTTIVTLINNEQRKIWEKMTPESYYSFDTIANQSLYLLASDMNFEKISDVLVYSTTDDVDFTQYEFAGLSEELVGYRYYDALENIGISPTPTKTGCTVQIRYQVRPTIFASSDTAVEFNLDNDYLDLVKFRVMSRIAKSGKNPKIELANNYESDANELERKLRMKYANKKAKLPKRRISYKKGWS